MNHFSIPARQSATFVLAATLAPLLGCQQTAPARENLASEWSGLSTEVQIITDRDGVPHIYGANDEDVFYGSGYAMASARLFEMELIRRRTIGTQSELFGEAKKEDDRFSRLMGFERLGKNDEAAMRQAHPEDHRLLLAWAAGVNARIDEIADGVVQAPYGFGPHELNFIPRHWTPADALSVGKLSLFGSANTLESELLATIATQLIPATVEQLQLLRPAFDTFTMPRELRPRSAQLSDRPVPLDAKPVAHAGTEAAWERWRTLWRSFRVGGSNNWAVDGAHTDNGMPILAGDPHQPLQSPSLMFMQHLNSRDAGGTLDVVGYSFVGTPGVQLGHNRDVAWTATNAYGDVMDLWFVDETYDETTQHHSITAWGKNYPVEDREEKISIRDNNMPTREATALIENVEGLGVLLPEDFAPVDVTPPGKRLLFRWVGFEATREATGYLALDRARSRADVTDALSNMSSTAFNHLAADRDGILLYAAAKVPDRGAPALRPMPWRVADGEDPGTEWTRYLTRQQLPFATTSAQGFICTANNDPWGFTADGTVENDPWYFGAFFAPSFRAHRIESELLRLTRQHKVNAEDMKALQLDTHSPLADTLVPYLREIQTRDLTPEQQADVTTLAQGLASWNRRMTRQSHEAVVFTVFAHLLAKRILSDELSFLFSEVFNANPEFALKFLKLVVEGEYRDNEAILDAPLGEHLALALVDTAEWLKERYGSLDIRAVRWSDLHGTAFGNTFGGELDGGRIATEGSQDTVNVSSFAFFNGNQIATPWTATSGPIFRLVTTFDSEGPHSVFNFPRGNSGEPNDRHFSDLQSDWVEGQYRPLRFARSEVEAGRESEGILSPGGERQGTLR